MRRSLRSLLGVLCCTALFLACGGGGGEAAPVAPSPLPTGGFTINHITLNVTAIPSGALDQARLRRMNLSHASVGGNVWSGLGALQAADASRYAFPNWQHNDRGNPGWQAKVDQFEVFVAANLQAYDVFQNKLCYVDETASFSYYMSSMSKLEGKYSGKRFVWWTMPLTTSGTANAQRATFNQAVRSYCLQNNKILFDIAAIESHDASGNPVTSGGSEAMAPAWSSDGGHLNAAGADRVAKAMWYLMARLGGWTGA